MEAHVLRWSNRDNGTIAEGSVIQNNTRPVRGALVETIEEAIFMQFFDIKTYMLVGGRFVIPSLRGGSDTLGQVTARRVHDFRESGRLSLMATRFCSLRT